MIHFYLTALIPLIIGGVLWLKNKNVTWHEWIGGTLIAFMVAGVVHAIAIFGQTHDIEIWSGQITQTTHHPRWVEEYQVPVYCTRTVGSGKNMRTERYVCGYRTEYRTHPEHWTASSNLDQRKRIPRSESDLIAEQFGGRETRRGRKPGFHSGDRNIYVAVNKTGICLPVTDVRSWSNKIKAGPSVFSFEEVPKDAPVFDWPETKNWRQSKRLLGTASKAIPILEWDRMCSRLGFSKRVNVILIGFGDKDSSIAHLQQAAWIGGKKNDLVLCYGGSNESPSWAYVFGWTDQELVKRNLETILLSNVINTDIIPIIETEIRKNYVIKDWSDFDYIEVTAPPWAYPLMLLLMALTQGVWYYFAHVNEFSKGRAWSRSRVRF